MNVLENQIASSPAGDVRSSTPRIVRLPEVRTRTGLSRTTLYQRMKEGSFPHTVDLGGRLVGWLESEINAWIAGRIAGTRQ